MEEIERRVTRDSSVDGRLVALEASTQKNGLLLGEIHNAVVGTASEPGLGERVRALERIVKVITGVAYATAAALAVAWGAVAVGPPRPPHP